MAEIVRMNENTWRIEDGGVRFFVLSGEEKALLVDTGMTTGNAAELARSVTQLPLELLNTHADRDHIAGNGSFDRFYLHPAEEENYRRNGGTGRPVWVQDGDVIDLGGRKLTVVALPGHTPGSITVLDREERALFGGDPIQDGSIFMFGEMRDFPSYAASLDRLTEVYGDAFDRIYPSHGSVSVEKDIVPKLAKSARDITAGKMALTVTEFHGRTIAVAQLGFASFLCDPFVCG